MTIGDEGKKWTSAKKVEFVLGQMANGNTREEVAEELGYKDWKGLDVLMRRQRYVFKDEQYVQKDEIGQGKQGRRPPESVRIVLQDLDNGNQDFELIAQKLGMKNADDVRQFMRVQGWIYSSEAGTYVRNVRQEQALRNDVKPDAGAEVEIHGDVKVDVNNLAEFEGLDAYLPLLSFLKEHQEELQRLLVKPRHANTIPRYRIPGGNTVTKSTTMNSRLDLLIRDFAKDSGISQRVVVETAILQFLEVHGYAKQVAALLHG